MNTDDPKVISLRPPRKPERSVVTHAVPGHVKLDGIRRPGGMPVKPLPPDLIDGDALERCGMGRGIPHGKVGRYVETRELRELRARCNSLAEAGAELEIAGRLVKTEAQTIARRITELLGEEDPKGAA